MAPHRGGRISPRRNEHDERFASTKRERTDPALLLLCPVSDTPLERTGRFAGTGPFLKSLTFHFFKNLSSQFVTSGFPFFVFGSPTRTFLPDLPSDSSTFPSVFLHPSRGTSQGQSWAILGPSWSHLGPSWPRGGAILGHLGAVLRPSWGHLGAFLAVQKSSSEPHV